MWEALIQGEENGLSRDCIRFRPSNISNPYREVFFENVNVSDITGKPREVVI